VRNIRKNWQHKTHLLEDEKAREPHLAFSFAQDIQPVGKRVGYDQQSNAIFQVHANGIDIGYKLVGSGEPIVMIMGFGRTSDRWRSSIVGPLSKKYQLIILDNRGMGHSTADDTPFTIKLFAEDVIGLLDSLHIQKANVLGYSMGSIVTQQLLLTYPQRINKAIIYGTSIDGSNADDVVKNIVPKGASARRQTEAIKQWKTPLDKMRSVTNPTMVLVGTSDALVGTQDSKTLASTIPAAWLVQFNHGSHGVMDEVPNEFVRIATTFFEMNQSVPLTVSN
jgi:pimeloyl-ACP methyl ester carboxylesterase